MKVQLCSPEESERILAALRHPSVHYMGRVESAICRNADGSIAWEVRDKPNLVTDYGRRAFLSGTFGNLRIVTSPSRETPLVERYQHADSGAASAGQESVAITPAVDTVTLTRSWATTFAAPATTRTIGMIGLGRWNSNFGAHFLYAYTLLAVAKPQEPTQTLEVVYKVTMSPTP